MHALVYAVARCLIWIEASRSVSVGEELTFCYSEAEWMTLLVLVMLFVGLCAGGWWAVRTIGAYSQALSWAFTIGVILFTVVLKSFQPRRR